MRILGITVQDEKRLEIGLTILFGIGISTARKILKQGSASIIIQRKRPMTFLCLLEIEIWEI